MSEMSFKETTERFVEGMKKAISRCRELSQVQVSNKMVWLNIANQLDQIRSKGEILISTKALSRQDVLKQLDVYQTNLKIKR